MESNIKSEIVTVSKQIGESTAVWFAASRSFVLFEKPAWDIFDKYTHNQTFLNIVDHIAYNYSVTLVDSQKFVNEIINRINQMNDPANKIYHSPELYAEFDDYTYPVFLKKSYLIGDKVIRFIYGSEWLMNCFHPAMAHLESELITSDQLFEIFELNDLLIFRYNGKVSEAFPSENSHYLRGTVTQKLFSVLYSIVDKDWMITLHSAAVSNGNSAIIFPSQAGTGKSTLSALLQAHGFTVLSDDFNVINKNNGFVYRLPLAISVKEGSLKILSTIILNLKKLYPKRPLRENLSGICRWKTTCPVHLLHFL